MWTPFSAQGDYTDTISTRDTRPDLTIGKFSSRMAINRIMK